MFWSLFFMFQGFGQSNPPVVTAIGNQIYCPLTQQNIITSFNIVDTDSNSTEAFYIQVSSGYVLGEDQLILTGSHPNVISNWNAAQAKLTLSPASGSTIQYTDVISAVYDVVFTSNNLNVGTKTFSLTIGEANFLDGHYYDFVSSYAIPWTTAKANAETMSYYGLQGYLATITNADEAQICGELSPGTGWIGASDVETEGVWKWVTGPEEGTIFWNGNQNGSAPAGMYSNWNAGEPNNSGNNEDYAHITDVSVTTNPGSWNDLPDSTASQPPQYTATGFVVEYGGMPGDPELSISASTSFSPPEILSTTPSTSCENEAANLEATSNTTDILWFDDEFGGNLLHSGNTYSPVLSSNETFWVLASENGCLTGVRVAINATVTPNETITIAPINPICQGDPNPLPNEIDGITGTWNPAFDATTTTEYTFTPDPGQCAIPPDPIEVVVNPLITPNVVPINPICQGDPNPLPNEIDGITGTWNPAFDATTTTEYTFTPDPGQCAIPPDPIEVVVNPLITPNVVPINPICQGDPNPLPNEIDGITGTWNPAFDATTTTEYTFTPDPGQCAIPPDPIEVVVNPLITPNVVPINPICQGDPNPLPNEIDGITGTWNPAFDATTTTEYTFTPDPGQCAIPPDPIEVVVNPLITPNVVPINPICQGDPNPLPNEIDGITGTWNPAFDATTTTEYTFTPDPGQCAIPPDPIEVVVNPLITPNVVPINPICQGDPNPLPNEIDGITGTWNPAFDATTTTEYTFIPTISGCYEEVTLEVTVLQQITPTFQIYDICIGETISSLTDFSQEGISGTWSPAINNLATTTYTFTPDPGQCANPTTETIQVNPINTLAITTENTSEPFNSNQIIEVTVTGGSGNYEYQLDEGNWQASSIFQNVVGCQDHIVKVRDAEGCSNEPESTVTILSYPKFFTPNGDGFNDFWNIKCLRNSAGLVSIFDRFGKLLKQFKTTSAGWNGTYNNKLMPTNDYWFLVTYFDENGIEKEFRSHFTLRR